MWNKREKLTYLKANRLADVIRLITILAVEVRYTFRTEEGISGALNGKPNSAATWFDIVTQHPEFFKLNREKNAAVLLLRSMRKYFEDSDSAFQELDINQTQALIDKAISLHDKQLSRYQRNSYRMPIIGACIAATAAIVAAVFSYYSTRGLKSELNLLNKKIDSISAVNIKLPTGLARDTVKPTNVKPITSKIVQSGK